MQEEIAMIKQVIVISVLACTLPLTSQIAVAADQVREQEQIYGYQLMTPQERLEYQERMQAAKTEQEREKIRLEHHEQMKARAKERGVTLPDDVPMRGMGQGQGQGMGPGGGMGPQDGSGSGKR